MAKTNIRLKENTQKAIQAQYATLAVAMLEAVVSLFFSWTTGSVALFSFGLDSVIESASTLIVARRLKKTGKVSAETEDRYERKALRQVGYAFIILATYVFLESVRKLYEHDAPPPSLAGIVIPLLSIAAMYVLSNYRHDLGHQINSKALIADSKQSQICIYMSLAVLAGTGLNYALGWWWADPLAAMAIAGLALNEGKNALEGKTCC